jgi:hypothetical protein
MASGRLCIRTVLLTKHASAAKLWKDGLREGSRIQVLLSGEQWRVHRPHPGKEAKRYQVDEVRELLTRTGNQP